MKTTLLGIIGNTLFIEAFNGGTNEHAVTVSNWTKIDLMNRGVIEYTEYTKMINSQKAYIVNESAS